MCVIWDVVDLEMFFEESNGVDRGTLIDQDHVLTVATMGLL